ncbi:cystinosin-like [Oratosquilla oratoria]|uniref:cystinosin-like n=1 Tax=Oratosquilla oratoria TaxID=337810 RepID=UPI003F761BC9
MNYQRLTVFCCLIWAPIVLGRVLSEAASDAREVPTETDVDNVTLEATAAFEVQDISLTIGEQKMVKFFVSHSGAIKDCVNFTFNYHPANPTFQPFKPLYLCPGNFTKVPLETKHQTQQNGERLAPEISNFRMTAEFGGRGPLLHALLLSTSKENGNYSAENDQTETTKNIEMQGAYFFNTTMAIVSQRNGKTVVTTQASPPIVDVKERSFVRVAVMASPALSIIADICGWIYTLAWSISFLPQILLNWRRKSTVGYCLDTVAFEAAGFTCYSMFNLGLFLSPLIKAQFSERHPTGVNHVRLNDAIFPVYSLFCDIIIIIQCCLYKANEKQRVSTICRVIVSAIVVLLTIGIILALTDVIWWIDVLYGASYVKLGISTIGYMPQVNENYRRKSTEGFSVQSIYLDVVGGSFSLLQMFLLAANYDEWVSILTDPTKLGLGILTLIFDAILLTQHHILYRAEKSQK